MSSAGSTPEKGRGDFQRKRKEQAANVPVLSAKESCVQALSHVLSRTVTLSAHNVPSSVNKGKEISLSAVQLPLSEPGSRDKLLEILTTCAANEVDVLGYCVGCVTRGSAPLPQQSWDPQVWGVLSAAAQGACAHMILQQLVQATASGSGSGDLWAGLYGGATVNRVQSSFLDMLSGWVESGLSVSPELLQRIAALALDKPAEKIALVSLVQTAGSKLKNCTRIDELLMKEARTLDGLERLLAEPLVCGMVGEVLYAELTYRTGADYEKRSVFADLLSVTMVMDKLSLQSLLDRKYACFLELRNFPNINSGDIIACHTQLQDALHRCQKILQTTLLKLFKSPHKNTVLGWLAAVVSHNEPRAGPRFRGQRGVMDGTCSDGWMVNLCAVLLELCRPFFASSSSGSKLPLIDPAYPSSALCRLPMHNELCLAHGTIADRGPLNEQRFLSAGTTFKFVTDLFFITQRALHVGLLPAVNQFTQTSSDLARQLMADNLSTPNLKELNSVHMLAGTSSLLDPQLVQSCSEFYITQAVWLTKQLEDCCHGNKPPEPAQRKLFAGLPEFPVKDMAVWFRFVVLGRPQLLQGLQLTPFVDCCVSLLERPDLLPSPLAQGRLVAVLLACLNSDQRGPQRLLGAEGWGGILGELSVMVQASPLVQDKLGPALLHTYSAVNVVEGLDVDKENFDKFATRYEVAQLLLRLWGRDDCKASILRECGTKRFQSFLGAVLDTLLYQLGDGLSRLVNVRNCEIAKEGGAWKSLSERERREKEGFLAGEGRAARGFITQASLQLELFHSLAQTDPVLDCLLPPDMARRTTATLLGFLETLCGPKSAELKVRDLDQYAFKPRTLVTQIAAILVQAWTRGKSQRSTSHILEGMAEYPEYNASTMSKCAGILGREEAGLAQTFTQLVQQVESIQSAAHTLTMSPPAPTSGLPDWQKHADSAQIAEEGLRELYVGALGGAKYESVELCEVHLLADQLPPTLDPRSPKVKAIMRDMRQMEESLPVHPDSAIFVRQDEDRMDLVRVLITGPTDTPYSRGCFVFDILYPASYPTNPPLVFLTTTGGGTIRFNPNLYADGKVCLSLLGTWHGGDATEKWDPLRSNLLQVLLSIQGMIMIPDPMFNEPGYEAIRGTPEGDAQSRQYNADIQVHTVRYAMLEQLRRPPKGFEDVIQVHFAIQQEALLKQLSSWLKDALSPDHERRLRRAVDELRAELDKQ